MTSLRKRKVAIGRQLLERLKRSAEEDRAWDSMTPVGREFGSPDFKRLMEEDYRNGVGVFDPAWKRELRADLEIPEDMPLQRRSKL